MYKILTMPSSIEEIEKIKDIVDGFIIGIENMCVNTNMCIKTIEILKKIDNEIFISINKNMHNSDLKKIEKILDELDNFNIKGVLYYDIAVLNIYKKKKHNYDLVWSMEHATTNYSGINYWNSLGVNYAYISSDISKEEIDLIIEKSKSKLMITMFGYLPMFVSKRHIVKNYLEYFDLKDDSKVNYIEKEDNVYPIIDNNLGTVVYSSHILNGIKEVVDLNIDYVVLNSFDIDLDKFIKVIDYFKCVNKDNVLEYDKNIKKLFNNIDEGFLDKKTIYRVKK